MMGFVSLIHSIKKPWWIPPPPLPDPPSPFSLPPHLAHLADVLLEEEAVVELRLALSAYDDCNQSVVRSTVELPSQQIQVRPIAMEIFRLSHMAGSNRTNNNKQR